MIAYCVSRKVVSKFLKSGFPCQPPWIHWRERQSLMVFRSRGSLSVTPALAKAYIACQVWNSDETGRPFSSFLKSVLSVRLALA